MRRIVIISALLIGSPPVDSTGTASFDQNGDGLSCYLEAPEGGGIFTVIDNAVMHR